MKLDDVIYSDWKLRGYRARKEMKVGKLEKWRKEVEKKERETRTHRQIHTQIEAEHREKGR